MGPWFLAEGPDRSSSVALEAPEQGHVGHSRTTEPPSSFPCPGAGLGQPSIRRYEAGRDRMGTPARNAGPDRPVLPLTDHLLAKVKSAFSCIEQLEKSRSQYLACPEGKKAKGWALSLGAARMGAEWRGVALQLVCETRKAGAGRV